MCHTMRHHELAHIRGTSEGKVYGVGQGMAELTLQEIKPEGVACVISPINCKTKQLDHRLRTL